MEPTTNEQQTEREREREDLHQPAVNRNRQTTPMQRRCATVGETCNQCFRTRRL